MNSADYTFGRARSGAGPGTAAVADLFDRLTAGMSHQERLNQVRFLAQIMDDQFFVPGTNIRFGLDSILGLFPGLGDVITSAVSLLIVHHAWQTGASPILLGRMLGNISVDFLLGAVPVVGDAFDLAWKANRKNARLLEQHLRATATLHQSRRG
jgi:Domain of unknown function (DUF4112)